MEGHALPGAQRFKGPDCVARRQMDACHEFFRKIGPDGKKGQVRRAEAVPYFREKACPGRISGKINARTVRRAQEKASPQGPVGVSVEWTAAAVMPCGGEGDGGFPIPGRQGGGLPPVQLADLRLCAARAQKQAAQPQRNKKDGVEAFLQPFQGGRVKMVVMVV